LRNFYLRFQEWDIRILERPFKKSSMFDPPTILPEESQLPKHEERILTRKFGGSREDICFPKNRGELPDTTPNG
jgi:hypothetical protein